MDAYCPHRHGWHRVKNVPGQPSSAAGSWHPPSSALGVARALEKRGLGRFYRGYAKQGGCPSETGGHVGTVGVGSARLDALDADILRACVGVATALLLRPLE